MAPIVEFDTLPNLREPVLVIALSGWVDAGLTGVGAVTVLANQLESARTFAHVDLSDLTDLQHTRPTVHLVDGVSREISWPELSLTAGRLGRDVVLCTGPEPSLRWRSVLASLTDIARDLKVSRAFTLGGIPAMASHRRTIEILSTVTSSDLADEANAWRQDYAGPTGAQTVLQHLLGEAGIPTIGLWAQVPHYVAAAASPPAIRALLARLRDLSGVAIDLVSLDQESTVYTQRVEEGLANRPDVVEVINAIESGASTAEDLPSGDEIASEIERFLRGQP